MDSRWSWRLSSPVKNWNPFQNRLSLPLKSEVPIRTIGQPFLHKQYKAFAVIVIQNRWNALCSSYKAVVVHPIVRNRWGFVCSHNSSMPNKISLCSCVTKVHRILRLVFHLSHGGMTRAWRILPNGFFTLAKSSMKWSVWKVRFWARMSKCHTHSTLRPSVCSFGRCTCAVLPVS